MEWDGPFSYQCQACGRCCHDQVIALSPYDLLRMARAAGTTTAAVIARYTLRRGSLLRFEATGCAALQAGRCTLHRGRPLACRLYPLGLEFGDDGNQRFIRLAPAAGSAGIYGSQGRVTDFLEQQGVPSYLAGVQSYRRLLEDIRRRLAHFDFETHEPREFRRVAVREALAESAYAPNPLLDAIFDADSIVGPQAASGGVDVTLAAHLAVLRQRIQTHPDAPQVAEAGVLLAVSLGYTPAAAFPEQL